MTSKLDRKLRRFQVFTENENNFILKNVKYLKRSYENQKPQNPSAD